MSCARVAGLEGAALDDSGALSPRRRRILLRPARLFPQHGQVGGGVRHVLSQVKHRQQQPQSPKLPACGATEKHAGRNADQNGGEMCGRTGGEKL